MSQAPALIRYSNPVARFLLRLGLPAGPNVLLTVRGRTSGLPRTAPVAVVAVGEKRWAMGAYGEVNWVRNLRAAGEADLRVRRHDVHVAARELDPASARAFYAETLPGYVRRLPWFGRAFARVLFRSVAPEILDDPERAAATHPVFELS